MRKASLLLPVVAVAFSGCTAERPGTGAAAQSTAGAVVSATDPDARYIVISASGATYSEGANERIDEVAATGSVRDQFAVLENHRYDSLSSLRMEGLVIPEGGTDTTEIEIVVMAMRHLTDSSSSAAYVVFINSPGLGWVVEPSIWSFVEPPLGSGFDRIDPAINLWIKAYAPVYSSPWDQSGLAKSAFDMKKWAKCTGVKGAARCGGCAVGCIVTAAGYLICLKACCAASFIGAAIECAATQLPLGI